jgi:HNH endonuclease
MTPSIWQRIAPTQWHALAYGLGCGVHRDGKSVARQLAAIVLEAFVGPCPPGQVIHYQDGDRRNCTLANLSYVTPIRQRELNQAIGPFPMRLHSTAKLTPLQARAIAASTERAVDLAERYWIAKQTVDAIRQGRIWDAVTRDVRRQDRRVTARQSRTR